MLTDCESEIAKWYEGKAVFITGATGFMGKVLVEKLLRSCPNVGPIYVLVREKKSIVSQERVQDMLASCLFDELRNSGVDPRDRVIGISGDVGLSDLGISSEDRRVLADTVSVVFHVAATVKFDEPLRVAVAMNLEGTKSVLELCKGVKNLSAVVHVSTAYSNCQQSVIEESVYPPPADPDKVLQYVAGLDDDALDFATPRLISNHPNTYTFTKALAEELVSRHSTQLPIVMVRPSIVSASWKEPQPGWVDNLNGPAALVVGTAKGLLKTMYGKTRTTADLIPVDVCINMFIAAAWEIGTRKSTKRTQDLLVYNCVSSPFKALTWNDFIKYLIASILTFPMSDAIMVPKIVMTASRVRHLWTNLIYQALPAYVIDFFIRFTGGKPKFQRYQSKLNHTVSLLEFFTTHEWSFRCHNVIRLKNRLNSVDQEIFDFDTTKMNWKDYVKTYFLGIRRNVMKEEDDTIPTAKRRIAKLRLASRIFNVSLSILVCVSLVKYYSTIFTAGQAYLLSYF